MAKRVKGSKRALDQNPDEHAELLAERAKVVARLALLEEKLEAMKCLRKQAPPLPLRRIIELVMKDEALTATEVYDRVIKLGFQFRSPNGRGTIRSTLARHFKYANGKYSRS